MPGSLAPQGPAADAIATTWWVMLAGATVILVVVMALVLYAVYRAPERRIPLHLPGFVAIGGIAFPVAVLTALLIYGTAVGRAIITPAEDPLRIEVVGHQWWWEVRYPEADGAPGVVTANEIHIPVSVPVEITLRSADVIHSFWVPALGGKMDLIPGRVNTHRLEASAIGVYRGQCAEFCGAQHANMGLLVTAEASGDFAQWREHTAAAARVTSGPGIGTFVRFGCAGCHAIRGTEAAGDIGPDLTHVGARRTLGAAALPNDPQGMRQWIANHGGQIKPGNRGPWELTLDESTVDELANYLGQLR